MKRFIGILTAVVVSCAFVFAGDAAVFEDIGFSSDGSVYVFGQYGKTDRDFESWAEIYTVDVAKNDFVRNEVYKTEPSKDTAQYSGKRCWENLFERTEWKLGKYNIQETQTENVIYVSESESKDPLAEIVFKDYEKSERDNAVYYHVKLVPTFNGSGKNVKSSFYINLEEVDSYGKVLLKKTVGTPSVKRQGVTGYRIVRIFTDQSGKSLVFIVEKKIEDDTGTSIRYMVETIRL